MSGAGTSNEESTARYLVCGETPWARRVFDVRLVHLPGQWRYTAAADWRGSLCWGGPSERPPTCLFFLHWRHHVPADVTRRYECIGFHLGDFARWRGGTPLQHQIAAGQMASELTMYRLTDEMDAGPVYATCPILLHGPAEAIYRRTMHAAAKLIEEYVADAAQGRPWQPEARPVGATVHPRRTPEQSALPVGNRGLVALYGHVRMLDAPGYPLAYLDAGAYRLTFRRAVYYGERIEADVTITTRAGAREERTP